MVASQLCKNWGRIACSTELFLFLVVFSSSLVVCKGCLLPEHTVSISVYTVSQYGVHFCLVGTPSSKHNSPTFHLIHISQFSSIMSSSTDLRWCSSCKTSRKSADFAVKKNGELKKTCAIHQKKRTLDDTSLDSWNSFVTKLSKFNHPVQSANSKF